VNKRLLALDWGQRRVGMATCNPEGWLVSSQGHFERAKGSELWILNKHDVSKLKKIVESLEIDAIVLGIPYNLDGQRGPMAEAAQKFAQKLKQALGLEVDCTNEALSSWSQSPSKDVDAAAAVTLLEQHLFDQKTKASKGLSLVAVLVLLCLLGTTGFAWIQYQNFALAPASTMSGELVVEVPPNSSLVSVRRSLEVQGLAIPKLPFKVWTKLSKAKRLRVGEYKVQKDWSPLQILNEVLQGTPILYRVTIQEGKNIYDIDAEFQKLNIVPGERDFLSLIHDPDLIERVGASNNSLEGFLFPETYTYQKYDSIETLVKSMISQFEERALPILKSHPWGQTKEGRYRLLTLASIVEKETGLGNEQPLVASVFWNRLNKGMRLQSDPTIIYGMLPHFDGNIRFADIRRPSPYNTYTIPELPIGPIGNPGIRALKATVSPASTKYLYFVGKGDNTHTFSESYEQHKRSVQTFQIDPSRRSKESTKSSKRATKGR
jgi:UPF0755 protein